MTLEDRLRTTDSRMLQAHDDAVRAFTFAARAKERFANGEKKIKREIFQSLGLNLTLRDRKVYFDSPEYLFTIKRMRKEAPIIAKRVEPTVESDRKAKMGAEFASIPSLLRG